MLISVQGSDSGLDEVSKKLWQEYVLLQGELSYLCDESLAIHTMSLTEAFGRTLTRNHTFTPLREPCPQGTYDVPAEVASPFERKVSTEVSLCTAVKHAKITTVRMREIIQRAREAYLTITLSGWKFRTIGKIETAAQASLPYVILAGVCAICIASIFTHQHCA